MRKTDLLRHQAAFQNRKSEHRDQRTNSFDPVTRIDALTKNARATWFTLLAALAFFGLTVMGFRHVDYFNSASSIKLPFVDIPVSTSVFFLFAPPLTAAVYCYFHLYLIRLFHALKRADSRIDNVRLGRKVAPWLLTDAALYLRGSYSPDPLNPFYGDSGPVERAATLVNFALAWGFGLIVIAGASLAILPLHNYLISMSSMVSLLVATSFGIASNNTLHTQIAKDTKSPMKVRARGLFWNLILSLFGIVTALVTLAEYISTTTEFVNFPINLANAQLTKRPDGWLPYDVAKSEYLSTWCARERIKECNSLREEHRGIFEQEWNSTRNRAIRELQTTSLDGLDFSNATLNGAFLTGANLFGITMSNADLTNASLEGSNMQNAELTNANLSFTRLEGATLSDATLNNALLFAAHMEGADLRRAQMERTALIGAQMERADLRQAQMERADLRQAQMEGADLRQAQMEGADLSEAQMEGADLRLALMEGAILIGTQMEGAVFELSELTGARGAINPLLGANLGRSTNHGGLLRFVDMTGTLFDAQTDFRNSILDGTVTMTQAFRTQMGEGNPDGPCQWFEDVIEDDTEFYGRWRGWIEIAPAEFSVPWSWIAPQGFEDVHAYDWAAEGCAWKTGPMPGAE